MNKSSITRLFKTLFFPMLLFCCPVAHAQTGTGNVCKSLQKRYGNVQQWGHGYILKANTVYAFADSLGRLVLPFEYTQMKPAFAGRMLLSRYYDGYIADDNGKILYQSSSPLYVLDSTKRRFITKSDKYKYVLNDTGRQLNGYDTTLSDGSLQTYYTFQNNAYLYGLANNAGDTILPLQYERVSVGGRLYAAARNDTVWVWERGAGLLFKAASFHECTILRNDFIAVKKYGSWALMSRQGKLLTGFKYNNITDLRYPYTGASAYSSDQQSWPPVIKQYALADEGQPKGMINAEGNEILPPIYDHISMNTNGWMILREAMHDKEELVDDKQRPVFSANAYDIGFVNDRYAIVRTRDMHSDKETVRTYDMQLRKFVTHPTAAELETVYAPKTAIAGTVAPVAIAEKEMQSGYDSMQVNRALTILYRAGGKWGVVSATGDTILPFIYDTAGSYAYGFYYVGSDSCYAALAHDGSLLTPLGLGDIPWQPLPDSMVRTRNNDVYSYKQGRLRKLDRDKEFTDNSPLNFNGGIAVLRYPANGMKAGIYNRQRKLLTTLRPYSYNDNGGTKSGLIAITDNNRTEVAVVDSTGHLLLPFMTKPRWFILEHNIALAVTDTSKPDVLYRFIDNSVLIDTVWLDFSEKYNLLYGHNGFANRDIHFTKAGYGNGFVSSSTGNVFFEKGLEKVVEYNWATLVKTNGKWQVLDQKNLPVLPAVYDSVAGEYDYRLLLFDKGKTGVYDWRAKKLYPVVYDKITYAGSLNEHFLIVRQNGKYAVISDKDKIISSGWDSIPPLNFSTLYQLPVYKNGQEYRIYATATDSVIAVPGNPKLPPGGTVVNYFMDGTATVVLNGKTGLYDRERKIWLIPAAYKSIKRADDYYIAHSAGETCLYDTKGKHMFCMKDYHEPQRINGYDQWFLNGWYGTPVVNNNGKIIVPDTFKSVFAVEYSGRHLYQAITKGDKRALFDSSGRMLIPAILDYVSDRDWMYNGYFTVSIDGKSALVNPSGKMLTPCMYADIVPGTTIEKNCIYPVEFRNWMHTEPEYQRPYFIAMREEEGKAGVLDSIGHVLIPCSYDSVQQVYHGKVAIVKNKGKWGLLTLKNKQLAPFKYDLIGVFCEGRASFKRGETTGWLEEDGTELPANGQ